MDYLIQVISIAYMHKNVSYYLDFCAFNKTIPRSSIGVVFITRSASLVKLIQSTLLLRFKARSKVYM